MRCTFEAKKVPSGHASTCPALVAHRRGLWCNAGHGPAARRNTTLVEEAWVAGSLAVGAWSTPEALLENSRYRYMMSWLRVFTSANTAHLGHNGGQEREPGVMPSEKYAARRGSVEDGMRMITACFARAPQRCTSRTYRHFLLVFHEVRSISKTCNQLIRKEPPKTIVPLSVVQKQNFSGSYWGSISKVEMD